MALAQRTAQSDTSLQCVPHTQAPRDHNVLPFPSPRVLLPVTFARDAREATARHASAQLAALLHSPLGVYVVDTDHVRDEVRVLFDIAPDDLDFTLHTLMKVLPQGVIGRTTRRKLSTDVR